MNDDLSDLYTPHWLYLDEFAHALRPEVNLKDDYFTMEPVPDTPEAAEVKAAIALLVRDRIIMNGQLNEAEFRFLEGRPDLRTTAWVNSLTAQDFNWNLSQLVAGVDTSKPKGRLHDHVGILIEIAASALKYFGEQAQPARRTPPEQVRALAALKSLYGNQLPDPGQKTPKDMLKEVNDHIGSRGRPITKDTLARVMGRRTKRA